MTSSANATFSNAVLFGSSLKSWKTQPMLRRRYGTFQFFILHEVLARDDDLPAWSAGARAAAGG